MSSNPSESKPSNSACINPKASDSACSASSNDSKNSGDGSSSGNPASSSQYAPANWTTSFILSKIDLAGPSACSRVCVKVLIEFTICEIIATIFNIFCLILSIDVATDKGIPIPGGTAVGIGNVSITCTIFSRCETI